MAGFIGNIDLWRSEEMQLVQLYVPSDSAHDTVAALGEIGLLQFKDLNPEKSAFQRNYANQVKRCDEMARKLRFLTEQVDKAGMAIGGRSPVWSNPLGMDELETKLEELEREMVEVNANNDRLQRTHAELAELQVLLEKGAQFFDGARVQAQRAQERPGMPNAPSQDFGAPLLGPDREASGLAYEHKVTRLGFAAGLISNEKLIPFERMLFRATRGNMLLRQVAVGRVQDPASGEQVEKSVFIVFFSGERSKAKIGKICEAFGANRYPFPEEVQRQRQMHGEVTTRLRELHTTIDAADLLRQNRLRVVAENLEHWTLLVRKEKAIYHTLNKMTLDYTAKVLVAEAWVPTAARSRVHEALRLAAEQGHTSVGSVLQPLTTHEAPPTFFRTNKFTLVFQTIVDAYGTARYREVNPTVYTIMTFPFLFAVMFGDLGHGFLMLFFALFLLANEKALGRSQLDDMSAMAFGGRFCILLMSLFSIYVGGIYNEFFSMPMGLFGGTKWRCFIGDEAQPSGPTDLRDCGSKGGEVQWPGGEPYAFGVDPVWRGTKTELPFLNSMKMKMSILIGVVHMNLGLLMSLFNNVYFRDTLSTWCEFVPQMIFLNGLFGYLSLLIVYKWYTGSLADLYHVMIYMFLSPGSMDDAGRLFDGQGGLQLFLLFCSLVAVPWMLLPKPLILKSRYEAAKARRRGSSDDTVPLTSSAHDAEHGGGHGGHGGHGEEFDFGEVMVHQMIHAIEFVLGAVSNTASYLRLWALSLAHSQLSSVFYDRVLMMTIASGSPGLMVVGFFMWAIATLGVLMVMESLSAFLHALRLHWVEFQNKFYRGDGYAFTPFTFEGLHGKNAGSDLDHGRR